VKRVGLLGGSFDPVHVGHLTLAHTALTHLQLDELRWVPAGHAWQKQGAQTSGEHRAAMVAAAIADEPQFVLDRCELDRAGPSYTIDTVRQLQAQQPDAQWTLVIGQDQYANLHTWKDWPELLSRVSLAVAGRDDALPDVRDTPLGTTPHRVVQLPMPAVPVSASAIRARLAAGQSALSLADSPFPLVPPAVASYIARHGLYLPPTTPSLPRS
jgi:nicotinate-nucleotide adenylyltransferase